MTKPALWTKGRPAALRVASEYRIPGLEADDIRQEALEALWVALDSYDPSRSSVASFARLVAERRLISLLRAATRLKRTAELSFSLPSIDVETVVLQREQLAFAFTDPRIENRRRWRDTKREQKRGMVGRTYLERGRPVTVLVRWGNGGGPRNVLIQRENGTKVVRTFRGLRRPPSAVT